MIRLLKWFFVGGGPGWLPDSKYVNEIEKIGPCCILDGVALPAGNRLWICVAIDASGTNGKIEARSGPSTCLSKAKPVIRTSAVSQEAVGRLHDLFQRAAKNRGSIRQAFIKDGFPASVRLAADGFALKFRCNLAVPPHVPDARYDLAKALLSLGHNLVGDSAYPL